MKKFSIILTLVLAFVYSGFGQGDPLFDSAMDKFGKKDFAGAVADFTKVIEKDNKNIGAFMNRGVAKQKCNPADYAGAIKDFDVVIVAEPKNFKAYQYRGLAKYETKNYAGAVSDLKFAASNNAKDLNSLLKIAESYELQNKSDSALLAYGDAHKQDSTKTVAYMISKVKGFEKEKKYKEAIALATTVTKVSPKSFNAYYIKGTCNLASNKRNDAVADFSKAIELNPSFTNAYKQRATIYASYGAVEKDKTKKEEWLRKACCDWEKIMELDPKDAATKGNFGANKCKSCK